MDKVTSGSITLDKSSSFLYVECDSEAFLYFVVSVIFFPFTQYRIFNVGLSMIKFILILSVCSFLTGECKPPVQPPIVYNSWADCATDASVKSLELLQKEGKDNVNKYRLAVKFGCYPVSET